MLVTYARKPVPRSERMKKVTFLVFLARASGEI